MGARMVQRVQQRGLRKFGVPPGGPMDDHAAAWANRMVDNSEDAPVLELQWGGAKLEALQDCFIAITGAPMRTSVPLWRPVRVKAGQRIEFAPGASGVWAYVAFGDDAGAGTSWTEIRDYTAPPLLRVWQAPQSHMFSREFFDWEWSLTASINRAGYRLITAESLKYAKHELLSEPVRVGTIQVPDDRAIIVTMRDGPTVGGYPKLGMVDPADLSWLIQCRPGQKLRFEEHH